MYLVVSTHLPCKEKYFSHPQLAMYRGDLSNSEIFFKFQDLSIAAQALMTLMVKGDMA